MKKLTLSLAAAGLIASSLGAYAAVPTGAAPFQVMVPNIKSGFDFVLEGLYLQPTATDLSYIATGNTPAGAFSTTTHNTSFNPDYDFGFAVGIGYVFPNSGNALRLGWTHFNQSSDDSTVVLPGTAVTRLTGGFDLLNRPLASTENFTANSDVAFKYDAIDLDMSQYMSIGTRFQTRLFAGLRYANLKEEVTNSYTYANTALPSVGGIILTSATGVVAEDLKFEGIGPRVGIDTSYHLGDCFGVTAHFATALLVGRSEASSNENATASFTSASLIPIEGGPITYTPTTIVAPTQYQTSNNQTVVVPAFDAKLGLDYTFGFNNDNSNAVLEAGYQVTQYVDALRNGRNNQIGVGFNGPYLSLDIKI